MPPSPACAFFDVDNTLLRGASGFHLAREMYRMKFFSTRDIAWFAGQAIVYGLRGESETRIAAIRARALTTMAERRQSEILAIGELIYERELEPRIFAGTRALIDEHLAAGDQVWLITATPHEIGDLLARKVGARGAVATVAEVVDDVYTGRLVGDLMHAERKALAVVEIAERTGVDLADCFAYGDSINDAPMLTRVGHPTTINPDRALRRLARKHGWPIVRMR